LNTHAVVAGCCKKHDMKVAESHLQYAADVKFDFRIHW